MQYRQNKETGSVGLPGGHPALLVRIQSWNVDRPASEQVTDNRDGWCRPER
jgi:hypothetical protein